MSPDENPQPIDPPAARPPGIPRWVKMSAILGGVLVLVVVVALLLVGGDHGPGRHVGGDGRSPAHTAPPGAHP